MFVHIFLNRLKCLVRDRQMLFWTLLYPLLLAALFGMAFSNLGNADNFTSIPIAVVNNAQYQDSAGFQSALQLVSDENSASTNKLFHIRLESKEEADADLQNNNIKGYILLDNGTNLIVKESDIAQSIIKQFLDTYLQTASAYQTIVQANPAAAAHLAAPSSQSYISELAPGDRFPTATESFISFYGLIGMTCLFGGFWGRKQISDNQADLTPQGARVNMAPIHKLKSLGYSLLAAILIQFIALMALLAFLAFVIGIDFGNQTGNILLTCLAGSMVGVAFGALIGAATKKNDHVKTILLISVSMLCSFLTGMMAANVKSAILQNAPILAYLNPANVISDAFYSLYYYSSPDRFYLSIAILFGMAGIFYLIVYLITRRQRYASI